VQALQTGGIGFAEGPVLTLADAGVNFAALSAADLANLAILGVSILDATDDVASFSLAQLHALADAGISLTAADVVTVADTVAALSELTPDDVALLASFGVDGLAVTEGEAMAISPGVAAQLSAIADFTITGATVALNGSGAEIAAIGTDDIAALAHLGVTVMNASDEAVTLDLAQAQAYLAGGITFATDNAVTLSLSLAEAATLDASDALDAAGVDVIAIDASPSEIKALSVQEIAALGGAGVDVIDLDPDRVALSAAQVAAFNAAGISFGDGDTVVEYAPLQLKKDVATSTEHATAVVDVTANDVVSEGFSIDVTKAVVTSGNGVVTLGKDGSLSVSYTGKDIDGDATAVVKVTYTATDGEMTRSSQLSVTFTATAEAGDDIIGTQKGDKLDGTTVGERIFGRAGNDVIHGLGGNDGIDGEDGNDKLYGDAGNDTLKGGDGKDLLDGGRGNDNLIGDAGADTLLGGAGKDKLNGGDGKDRLDGGAGNDTLTGGDGADTFIFGKESGASRDVVTDFHAIGSGHDVIDLSDFDLTSFKALKGLMEETGKDVVIDLPESETIVLKGVHLADLGKSDFLL
jgi:Ca2+-binding RTX toxin-like protein